MPLTLLGDRVAALLRGTRGACGLALLVLALGPHDARASGPTGPDAPSAAQALAALAFEENVGQFETAWQFVGRTTTVGVGVAADRLRVVGGDATRPSVFELRFEGSRPGARVTADGLPGRVVHYLRGTDRQRWFSGVRTVASVRVAEIYDGVDLRVYANADGALEFDLIITGRADPSTITMRTDGDMPVRLVGGDLVIGDRPGFRLRRPIAYQERGDVRRPVDVRYRLAGDAVTFELGAYDASKPLVIDPVVTFVRELAGTSTDRAHALAVDETEHVYVAGETWSADLFATATVQPTRAVAPDAFVAKLSPDGNTVLFATYLGGEAADRAQALVVDGTSIYVAGVTSSSTFPRLGGSQAACGSCPAQPDGFVTRLTRDGSAILYSTFLGGSSADQIRAAVSDGVGGVHLAGETSSPDFPTTGAPRVVGGDADAFVARLSPTGTLARALVFGGTHADRARALAVTPGGTAVVAGDTASANFPITDALDPTLSESAWFVSPDNGGTWIGQQRPGAPRTGLLYVDTPSNHLYVLDVDAKRLWRSADAGVTWSMKAQVEWVTLGPGGRLYTLYLPSGLGGPTVIQTSQDYGATWTTASSGAFSDATCAGQVGCTVFGTPSRVVADPVDSARVVAFGPYDVWLSTDGGKAWEKIVDNYLCTTGTERVRQVLVGSRIYVAGFRCITRIDGNTSQEVQPADVGNNITIDVVPGAEDTVAVADDSGHLFVSSSSGSSWSPRGAVPGNGGAPSVFGIWMDPRRPAAMYALMQDGVPRSTDGGVTWSRGWTQGVTPWENGGARPLFPVDRPGELWLEARSFQDAFVARISAAGTIERATFVGGAADDTATGVGVDAAGHVHVAGTTISRDFPTAAPYQAALGGGQDLFVAALTPTLSAFRHATFLGGATDDEAFGLSVTADGEAVVAGHTAGTAPAHLDGPALKSGANCGSCGGRGVRQAYVAKLRASGRLRWAGLREDPSPGVARSVAVAVVARGTSTWVAGATGEPVFPGQTLADVLVMRLADPVCTTMLSPAQTTIAAAGGTAATLVTVGVGCEWAASVDQPWARVTSGAIGAIGGQILVQVDANPGAIRSATVSIEDRTLTIIQAATGSCVTGFSSGPAITAPAFRTTLGAGVTAPAGCTWTAVSLAPWIQTTSTGSGPGDLRFTAQSNTGTTPRTGVIDLGGFPLAVTQLPGAPDVTMRYLAEGATSPFFETRLALLNPGDQTAVAAVTFQRASGVPLVTTRTVPPRSRATIVVNDEPSLSNAEFSMLVESTHPLVVDRTMTWTRDAGYGSHAETAVVAPARTWYLAEGATHSGFELFYLLQNPQVDPADVLVRYLRPDGPPLEKTYRLPPTSRTTIWVDLEEFDGQRLLASTDVSAVLTVTSGPPVIVERAMYLSNQGRSFNAGHASAGVTAPATRWLLAEGATGSYFDLFVLLANPTDTDARVRLTYLLPDGTTYTRVATVAANRRVTVWVDEETPDGTTGRPLADTAVSTTVDSLDGVPIIVERAMWWPGTPTTWHEAHNSPGSTAPGSVWALAEGEVGADARRTDTYVLVANTSATSGSARVTLMFEDGTTAVRTFGLPPSSRTNISVRDDFPEAIGRRFGTLVESLGTPPAAIVVERAMYTNGVGQTWAAGSNALGTRVR